MYIHISIHFLKSSISLQSKLILSYIMSTSLITHIILINDCDCKSYIYTYFLYQIYAHAQIPSNVYVRTIVILVIY